MAVLSTDHVRRVSTPTWVSRDGKIVAIGDLRAHSAQTVIDASDKIVAPGFIDAHTHDDQALLSDPDMTCKVSQGVTTVITGNCGISAAPLDEGMPLPMPLSLLKSPNEGRFTTFRAYLDALRAAPATVNVAAMIGHSTLRVLIMEDVEREANNAEILAMQERVEEAMQAGAIGLSTGTFYATAMAASTAEIVAVGAPLTEYGGLYVTHMRDESDGVMTSLEETFEIGRQLDVAVVISHHKVANQQNFGRSADTLPFIHKTMQHQCVSLDCYPYNASATMLRSEPKMLTSKVLVVSSDPHPEMAGRDLDEIAAEWQVSKADAAARLQPGSAIYFQMDENDVQRIMAFDETMIGSDGIQIGERPHPRLWGTFPRVLGHYSRDVGLFPLETAVWKMTGLTAKNFGLAERGTIEVGKCADVVVFDPVTVRDAANYADPTTAAEGIDIVMVNGAVAWRAGQHLHTRTGQVLKRTPGNASK